MVVFSCLVLDALLSLFSTIYDQRTDKQLLYPNPCNSGEGEAFKEFVTYTQLQ